MTAVARNRLRRLSLTTLLLALGMLLGGLTLLAGRLSPLGFIGYWGLCLVLTLVAMSCALWEAGAVRRRTRQEQRELLNHTVEDIQRDARARHAKRPTWPRQHP